MKMQEDIAKWPTAKFFFWCRGLVSADHSCTEASGGGPRKAQRPTAAAHVRPNGGGPRKAPTTSFLRSLDKNVNGGWRLAARRVTVGVAFNSACRLLSSRPGFPPVSIDAHYIHLERREPI
jgi:hypothetical protein